MSENQETRTTAGATNGCYRPKLSFYHASPKGTGCAVQFELLPARGDEDGCVMMQLANQLTLGDRRGATPVYPRFDWDNKMVVKLGFGDLTKMLQVFRGECEELENGKGLYHMTSGFSTKIVLRHLIDPVPGYSLEVYRNARDGKDENRAHILLYPNEALGLACSLESSFGYICFGVPAASARPAAKKEEVIHAVA